MSDPTVTLIAKEDDRRFKTSASVAIMSGTIKSIMGLDDGDAFDDSYPVPIPVPAVEGDTLELVLKYCTHHHENQGSTEEEINAWDQEFINKLDDEALFSLILAANYLDIKSLLDLACKAVAVQILEYKTPSEIRRRFNIKNDFTPEEEEVRKENAWCEER